MTGDWAVSQKIIQVIAIVGFVRGGGYKVSFDRSQGLVEGIVEYLGRPRLSHQSSEFKSTIWQHLTPRNEVSVTTGHSSDYVHHLTRRRSTTVQHKCRTREVQHPSNFIRHHHFTRLSRKGICSRFHNGSWVCLGSFYLRTERFQYLKRYSPACTRLLSQYKTMLKLLGSDVLSVDEFMKRYRVSFGPEDSLYTYQH